MRRLKKLSKRSRTSGLLAGCLAVVALLATASAASAVTYRPTRTDDPVPNGCQKHNCSLREAVIAANASGIPATILLRPGKRYELTRPGPGEDAALTGDLDVTAPLLVGTKGLIGTRQRHRGTKLAVIDGNGIDRVFDIHATTLRLVWTVVRGGHARRTAGDDGNGGAIRGGVLKIHSKSRLVDNVADGNGGAFANSLFPRAALQRGYEHRADQGKPCRRKRWRAVRGERPEEVPADGQAQDHPQHCRWLRGRALRLRFLHPLLDHRRQPIRRERGGIALSGTGSSGFDWSTVSGNIAALSGGGVYTTAPGGGPVAEDKGLFAAISTIANNRAGADGGGIAAPGGGRPPTSRASPSPAMESRRANWAEAYTWATATPSVCGTRSWRSTSPAPPPLIAAVVRASTRAVTT